jgi:catechol 1,2-dioxygenase
MDHEQGFFTEADSAEVVAGRNAMAKDQRLREVMEVIVRHLHAAVKEIEPTEAEWMEAILFLTAVGQKCTDWRQEWILLSDTLGVSMLVDAINHRKPSGASPSTVLGPFHVGGAPELPMGADICRDGKGEPMRVSGRILDTRGNPVKGASSRASTRSPTTARSAGCSTGLAATRSAPRTCTTSSRRRVSSGW